MKPHEFFDHSTILAAKLRAHTDRERFKLLEDPDFDFLKHFDECQKCQHVARTLTPPLSDFEFLYSGESKPCCYECGGEMDRIGRVCGICIDVTG